MCVCVFECVCVVFSYAPLEAALLSVAVGLMCVRVFERERDTDT